MLDDLDSWWLTHVKSICLMLKFPMFDGSTWPPHVSGLPLISMQESIEASLGMAMIYPVTEACQERPNPPTSPSFGDLGSPGVDSGVTKPTCFFSPFLGEANMFRRSENFKICWTLRSANCSCVKPGLTPCCLKRETLGVADGRWCIFPHWELQ